MSNDFISFLPLEFTYVTHESIVKHTCASSGHSKQNYFFLGKNFFCLEKTFFEARKAS